MCAIALGPPRRDEGRPGHLDRRLAARTAVRPAQDRAFADELADEQRLGPGVKFVAGAHLLDPALVEHGDPVRQDQRLLLIMRHIDEGGAKLAVDALDLELQHLSQLLVQRAEGFVHEKDRRAEHHGARQCHALLLAAGKLARVAVGEPLELHLLQHLLHRP